MSNGKLIDNNFYINSVVGNHVSGITFNQTLITIEKNIPLDANAYIQINYGFENFLFYYEFDYAYFFDIEVTQDNYKNEYKVIAYNPYSLEVVEESEVDLNYVDLEFKIDDKVIETRQDEEFTVDLSEFNLYDDTIVEGKIYVNNINKYYPNKSLNFFVRFEASCT